LQVNGRDELPIPEKAKLEVAYLQRQSLWFDVRILWLTFVNVLRRDGVSHWWLIWVRSTGVRLRITDLNLRPQICRTWGGRCINNATWANPATRGQTYSAVL